MIQRRRSMYGTAALLAAAAWPAEARAAWSTDVSAAERAGYSLVYTKDLGTASNNGTPVVYATDNSGSAPANFDRVGYYMELTPTSGPRQFVWTSFDRLAGMSAAAKTGVPNDQTGEFYQENLSNMTVESNVSGVVTGTGIQTGNIEFWSTNYAPQNSANVPNADPNTFDFGDQATPGGYGSMQVHNHDLDGTGPGIAGQTLFAYNNWGGGGNEEGIGNQVGGSE